MNIWVDDRRPAPTQHYNKSLRDAWVVIELLKTGKVRSISLDDDLGNDEKFGTGLVIAKWIEDNAAAGCIPRLNWNVHCKSAMAEQMKNHLHNADKHWDEGDLDV